MTEMDYW